MQMKTILACAACLVAGMLIGRLLPKSDQPPPSEGVTPGMSARSRDPAGARPWQEAAPRPAGEEETGVLPVVSGLPDPPQNDDLVVVPTALIGELSLAAGTRSAGQDLFSRDGRIEAILQITDREKAAVQTAWRGARQKIRDLEATSSVTEDLDDGSVRITVPDLADSMASLGRGFQSLVEKALGENRGGAFMAMKQVDRIFAPATGERTYEVVTETIGDGGWRYRMTMEGGGRRRVWVAESIPDEIRHLTDVARILPSIDNPPGDEDESE